jgi:hypothetical protein
MDKTKFLLSESAAVCRGTSASSDQFFLLLG